MPEVGLTFGFFAQVDSEDYSKVVASGPWDKRKPDLYFSVGGTIFLLHFQLGRFMFAIETSKKTRAKDRAERAERAASASRHPAA